MSIVIALLAGFVLATLQASFMEWTFHRYWLHRPWLPEGAFTSHTLIHHQLCKFEDTFHVHDEEQEEALTFQWWAGPLLVGIGIVPWLLLAWGLSALGLAIPLVPFVLSFSAAMFLYYLGYEGMHHMMHKPRFAFIERWRYFQFIKRHHRIHHTQMDRNLNIVLPFADFCLGTLVLEEPPVSATPEGARRLARRHSKFGRRLREHEVVVQPPDDEERSAV